MGLVLADYADRPDQSGHRSRPRRRQARVRCDDGDEKDRHRCNRGGAPRLKLQSSKRGSRCLTSIPVAEIALPPSAYRENPAPFDLRAYVACTWMTVSRPSLPTGLRPVIPDGCVDIIAFGDAAPHVAGPATFTQWVRPPAAGVLITGIRFRPGAVRAVLGCSAEAIRNCETPLADICG